MYVPILNLPRPATSAGICLIETGRNIHSIQNTLSRTKCESRWNYGVILSAAQILRVFVCLFVFFTLWSVDFYCLFSLDRDNL